MEPDMKNIFSARALAASALLFASTATFFTPASTANAAELPERTFCVFDLLGKAGPIGAFMEDYRLEATKWGINLKIKTFTDEKIVTEEFKARTCDGAAISGLRGRSLNPFTGTIDSLGALPRYDQLHAALAKLATPAVAPLMINGSYEVVGILPAGGAHLMSSDRDINTAAKVAGKRIAAMDFDKAQAAMAEYFGGSPITANMSNVGSLFNNGAVDIIGAPLLAIQPLELYKGLGEKGGIADFAIVQLTGQLYVHHDRFPEAYGQKSREYVFSQYDRALADIQRHANDVDPKYWVKIPENDLKDYLELYRKVRISLREQGIYNGKMLSFLSRVRCSLEPFLTECTAADRE
ncbi:probable RND type efflux pump involved in aminoglycoside resistance [gamma proteobacterium HdN1]|nr:probable RND type efflux pump involved in aminoglycoside resistance [gamma proteobacterium HdN1]